MRMCMRVRVHVHVHVHVHIPTHVPSLLLDTCARARTHARVCAKDAEGCNDVFNLAADYAKDPGGAPRGVVYKSG